MKRFLFLFIFLFVQAMYAKEINVNSELVARLTLKEYHVKTDINCDDDFLITPLIYLDKIFGIAAFDNKLKICKAKHDKTILTEKNFNIDSLNDTLYIEDAFYNKFYNRLPHMFKINYEKVEKNLKATHIKNGNFSVKLDPITIKENSENLLDFDKAKIEISIYYGSKTHNIVMGEKEGVLVNSKTLIVRKEDVSKDGYINIDISDLNINKKLFESVVITNTYKINDSQECIDGELWERQIETTKKINMGTCKYRIKG